jgi:hypothetical protein
MSNISVDCALASVGELPRLSVQQCEPEALVVVACRQVADVGIVVPDEDSLLSIDSGDG